MALEPNLPHGDLSEGQTLLLNLHSRSRPAVEDGTQHTRVQFPLDSPTHVD
jgi:hypothetical protein